MSKLAGHKNLEERYLLWLYKTAKENLDRIDRKFTQLGIDKYIFKQIKKSLSNLPDSQKKSLKRYLSELANYIAKKEKDAFTLRFSGKDTENPDCSFLRLKLFSIEAAIKKFLGNKKLKEIRLLYHREMVKWILEEKIHK